MVTSSILHGIAVGILGGLCISSGISIGFTLGVDTSFSWIISSTSSGMYSTLFSSLAICRMAFRMGSPACIDGTLFLGSYANMVIISSTTCLR